MEAFAQWAVDRGLILVSQAAAWAATGKAFFESLWRHAEIVDEMRWIDCLADHCRDEFVLPSTGSIPLCGLALNPLNTQLFDTYGLTVLAEFPVTIVGLLDPFTAREAKQLFVQHHPHADVRFVSITPKLAASYAAKLAQGDSAISGDPFLAHIARWSGELRLGTFNRIEDLCASLWDLGYPVLPSELVGDFLCPLQATVRALLFARSHRRVWAITPNPTLPHLVDTILQETGLEVICCVCPPEVFDGLSRQIAALLPEQVPHSDASIHVNSWNAANESSGLWHHILTSAIAARASDIHIEPKQEHARIRFRIDGALRTQAPISATLYPGLLREIKTMGQMNQNLTGKPQDGSRHIYCGGQRYDQRYSVIPTRSADEAVVVRIFDQAVRPLSGLSLKRNEVDAIRWALTSETGLVVISGPTGSGKTTTLYALLNHLNSPERKLFTVEDPVERHFEDAVQIEINEGIGWSWEAALKYTLRQDPDILLIGELRDAGSARVALQAANTGHKVLTTIHANDAVGAISRLIESFQIDRESVASSLRLSLAQRLVPRLCLHCRTLRAATPTEIRKYSGATLANPVLASARGCSACRGTGRQGRHLIIDLLPIDATASQMIGTPKSLEPLREYNTCRGFPGLSNRAATLLFAGEIDLDDARRFFDFTPS